MLEQTRTSFAVAAKANALLAEPRLLSQARTTVGELRRGYKRAEELEARGEPLHRAPQAELRKVFATTAVHYFNS